MQFSELGKSTQTILKLCRQIGFGQLTDLVIVNGELHTTAASRKQTSIRLDKAPATLAQANAEYDFLLCTAQEQLVRRAHDIGNGHIMNIEIRDGRPVSANFEETVAEI